VQFCLNLKKQRPCLSEFEKNRKSVCKFITRVLQCKKNATRPAARDMRLESGAVLPLIYKEK